MTFVITLAKDVTADLTNCNTSVMKVLTNSATPITTPVSNTDSKENEVMINIGLISNQYNLTFDLTDGIDDWDSTPVTNFGKLYHLARIKAPDYLTFTWGPIEKHVIIVGLRCGTQPGKKDLLEGCSMTLQESMAITF